MLCPLYNGYVPGARNAWSEWVESILSGCGVVQAAVFTVDGQVNAFSGRFAPSREEINSLNTLLGREAEIQGSVSTMKFNRCTYVIKQQTTSQNIPDVVASSILPPPPSNRSTVSTSHHDVWPRYLVGFNGHRYLLVCRVRSMYLVALVDSRGGKKVEGALRNLSGLGNSLVRRNF